MIKEKCKESRWFLRGTLWDRGGCCYHQTSEVWRPYKEHGLYVNRSFPVRTYTCCKCGDTYDRECQLCNDGKWR